MRRTMVAGNWKMHGSQHSIRSLMGGILAGLGEDFPAEIVVFPPFPYLPLVQALAGESGVEWGGQTLNPHDEGAYTGEVAGPMLRDFGCRYVLVGHSERRALYGEGNADVAARYRAAQSAGLVPVLCVGETLAEREEGATEETVAAQLDAVLDESGIASFAKAVVAYEPVWAIGTGRNATPAQAQEAHGQIRHRLGEQFGAEAASACRIIYGGSVKPSNVSELTAQADVDGSLVGGASLEAPSFAQIVAGSHKV